MRLISALVGAMGAIWLVGSAGASPWVTRSSGIETAEFTLVASPRMGNGKLLVVRIDPTQVQMKFVLAAEEGRPAQTTSAWTDQGHLEVAINAGMYEPDFKRTTGYCRDGPTVVNSHWNSDMSAFAFGPLDPKEPPAIMVDLDQAGSRERLSHYRSVVQNLRLIKGNGINVWTPKPDAWSEAAVAMDGQGHVLFLFSRTPLSMKNFNDRLLALPLGIVRAMHVEGGPEASLSIRTSSLHLDLMGSYEAGFQENDDNHRQWSIPNVIGVAPRR